MHEIVIIGSGISGLSFAHYCAGAGLHPVVLEKEPRIGGCFHSQTLPGDSSGFRFELGAHTGYNSYRRFIEILKECTLGDRLLHREKVPFRMIVNEELRSITSQIGFFELARHLPRLLLLSKEGQTVESYYSRVLGQRNYENVMRHLFNAVVCQEADEFPADMLFKKRPKNKGIPRSFTLPSGLQEVTDAIASDPRIEVLREREVDQVVAYEDGFKIVAQGGKGEALETRHIAFATPPDEAARILRQHSPELSARLATIGLVKVETVGVALERESVSLDPLAGIVTRGNDFYSVVSSDTVANDRYRGFAFHFKPGQLDSTGRRERICQVLGIDANRLKQIVEKSNSVPSPRLGHDQLIGNIDALIAGKGIFLTGNYFQGVSIEDCVSRSHDEFSRLLAQRES
ncbi:MAG: NAD(P)-binding protein [Verrucomicrobiae bacterium]|nr:NAD(P)-binding protein [Verrucomicrobiae bacterium]